MPILGQKKLTIRAIPPNQNYPGGGETIKKRGKDCYMSD